MAKKFVIFSLGVLVMLFLVFAITTLVSTEASAQEETWDREDEMCDDLRRERTTCTEGGKDECEVIYCVEI